MSAIEDITDDARKEAIEIGQLIEDAEPDWLREALHSVVGICSHHEGVFITQILEVLRYELAEFDVNGDAF